MRIKKFLILLVLITGIFSFKPKPKTTSELLPKNIAEFIKKAKPMNKMYKKNGKLFPLMQVNYWDGCRPTNIGGMCYPACDCKLMIFYVSSNYPFIHQVSVDQVTDSNCMGISKPNVCSVF